MQPSAVAPLLGPLPTPQACCLALLVLSTLASRPAVALMGHGPLVGIGSRAQPAVSDRRFFLWLSDVHVDPYYGTATAACGRGASLVDEDGVMGCDPPSTLWKSTLAAAARFGHGAEFVLHTGDLVRHKQHDMPNPYANVSAVMASTAQEMSDALHWLGPERILFGPQGNDDSPRDYELNITSGSTANPWIANIARSLVAAGAMTPDRAEFYARGGFFEAEVGASRVLSLNTVIYSVMHVPARPAPADPFGQFKWLRARLRVAAQQQRKVWLMGHIPPGIETYGYTALWQPQYLRAYLDIVQDPELGGTIAAQLFGHVHADEFRLLPSPANGTGPVLLSGALSPIYRNNPSFRIVEYDATSGELLNVKVFWAKLPRGKSDLKWEFAYDFRSNYEPLRAASGPLAHGAFKALSAWLLASWADGGDQFHEYAKWYKTNMANDLLCCELRSGGAVDLPADIKSRYINKYFCSLEITTQEDFAVCSQPFSLGPLPDAAEEPAPAKGNDLLDPGWDFEQARRRHWRTIGERIAREDFSCLHMLSII